MTKKAARTGKDLERRVADAYREMRAREVKHNVELAGNQIDVYVELETPGRLRHRIAVEAKDWTSPVGIDTVNGFAHIVDLLHRERLIDEGIIVSAAGFSRQARNAARTHGIQLLEPADLDAMVEEAKAAERTLPTYTPPPPPDPATLPEPRPLPPGSRLLFHRNVLFTGRAELLKALAHTLLHVQAPSTIVTQAVHGMRGVGKTQFAVEFAYRYGRFFHGVHWLNADPPDALGAEIAACGEAMCLPGWPKEQPRQVARTLDAWRQGGPRLVILDNLKEVSTAREWLGRLNGSPVRLLLTTCRSGLPADLGLIPLRLRMFTLDESRAFLRHYLPAERATDADLKALAQRLGHLPLALELAGRYLERHRRLSVTAYLNRLQAVLADPAMRGWREDLGSPTGHELDLMHTFALSWKKVPEGAARRLFCLAGYCAPHRPIPYQLLQQAADLDDETCDEALDQMANLGLLHIEAPEIGPTIHPLLAEYARSIPCPGEGTSLLALACALVPLARQANEASLPAYFAPLRPHVEAVAAAAEAAELEQAGALWDNLGYHLKMVADYGGAQEACERARAIAERVYGPDHHKVATYANHLGDVLKAQGNLEGALDCFAQALTIDEATFGSDHPNVARHIESLGWMLKDQDDLAGARYCFWQALAIDEAAFGFDHPEVVPSVNSLGWVFKDLGNLEGALDYFKQALAIDEAAFGPDHLNVARDVNNLGWVLRDMGDLAGARAAFERALRIFEELLPPEHSRIRETRENLESVK